MSEVAVLYGAKSTLDVRGSIPTQLEDCRNLAEGNGLQVVKEFKDEKASAYTSDRGPELAKAMAHCERLPGCTLVVQHSDRLARGDAKQARHLIEIVLWSIKTGVRLLSVQDPEMLAGGDMALLMGAIGGMRNNEDSRRKGLAVKDGLKRRVTERRQFVGGRRPYGYRWMPTLDDDGQPVTSKDGRIVKRLTIDPAEAAVVRRIFAEYLRGVSQNRIARDLMHDGVATLTPSGSWYATTVRGMLANPLYVGRVVLAGEDYPGEHEPIIDSDAWDRACKLREARNAQGRPRGRRTAGRHLLTEGLLRCTCGSPMSTRTARDNRYGTVYETYVCVKRLHHGPSACSQPPIKRELIDGAVYVYFETVALDGDATRQAVKDHIARELGDADASRGQAETEMARIEAALVRIEGDYIAGKLSAAKWERLETRLQSEMDAARAEADQHQRRHQEVQDAISAIDVEAEVAQKLTALRQMIVGEVKYGTSSGLDSLRATLKLLFVGFELACPARGQWYGSGALQGQVWAQDDPDGDCVLGVGDYVLIPVIQPTAVDGAGVQRAELALHDNLCSRLAAW